VNRLQRLITDWERDSGMPVRRLNLRVAAMMLAGALGRISDDQDDPVFLTRGGVAMELRPGEKARVTRDVDLVLRSEPSSLIAHLDAAFAEDYKEFSFERDTRATGAATARPAGARKGRVPLQAVHDSRGRWRP
jgi:hypothetical protein